MTLSHPVAAVQIQSLLTGGTDGPIAARSEDMLDMCCHSLLLLSEMRWISLIRNKMLAFTAAEPAASHSRRMFTQV